MNEFHTHKVEADLAPEAMIHMATSAIIHNINTVMEIIVIHIGNCEDAEAERIGAAMADFCTTLDKAGALSQIHASVIAFAGSYEEEAVNHLHKTSIEGQERALKELMEIHKIATAKEGKPN